MRLDSYLPPWELTFAVNTCDSLDRLRQLKQEHSSPFAEFASWNDVRCWLEDGGIWREAADGVLRPVLAAYKQRPDQAWQEILLFLFWRPLARIQGLLLELEPEPTCRFSQTCWAFLHVLERIDLNQRPRRLGTKILQDVRHDARLHFATEHERSRDLDPLADEIDQTDAEDVGGVRLGGALDGAIAAVELRHDRSWAMACLKALVHAGRLSRTDFLILIGCHLYGWTLDEMAERQGLSYQAMKKRRQRAADLLKEIAPDLSPDLPDTPLMSLRRSPRKEKGHDGEL